MAKFHINTKTGTASACRATQGKCPFGTPAEHFTSKEAAQEAFEADQSAFIVKGKDRVKKLKKRIVREAGLDFDIIQYELEWITEWEKPWTPHEEENMAIVQEIAEVVEREPFTAKDEKEARKLIESMHPYVVVPRSKGGWSSSDTSWRARDKTITKLGENLLIRRLADQLTHEPADAESNSRLMGLEAAQDFALNSYNRPTGAGYKGVYLGEVEPHFQEAIARVKRGDEPTSDEILKGEDQRSLLPDSERIFNKLHPDSPIFEQKLYLTSVYPVNELKAEMDRAGIDNVSVSSFENTREWGNVYTVMQPDGNTRSFSVYEHRNTDSIIINGSENWDGKGLPYAGDSKNHFYAEFAPTETDRKRSAQALTFYMMQAQSGTLETDVELVDKASHRDWNAILDAQIPGFKQWRQEKITDTYIAPENESEEDTLARLDF